MLDIDEPKLVSYLNNQDNAQFIAVFKAICDEMGAHFVKTELRDCLYELCHGCFRPKIDMTILDAINKNRSMSFVKSQFSCCERKIFGHFDNKTPDGQLFVKFKMCNRCEIGLYYQREMNNSLIQVFDGLNI